MRDNPKSLFSLFSAVCASASIVCRDIRWGLRAIVSYKLLPALLVYFLVCNLCIASEIDTVFGAPRGIAIDKLGNMYVADYLGGHTRIAKIDSSRNVRTLVKTAPGATLLTTDAHGNVYLGNGGLIQKIDPSGSLTTLHKNRKNSSDDQMLRSIGGIAIDKDTNIYVADVGAVRKLTPSGRLITVVTAPSSEPHTYRGIAVDSNGNIFVADERNHIIQKIAPDGAITTVAGLAGQRGDVDGIGSESRFFEPIGIAIDSVDNVYVAEYGNGSVRRVSPSGIVTTLPGTAHALGLPVALALDQSGNIFVADVRTNSIHKISPKGVASISPGLYNGYAYASSLCQFNESQYFSCSVRGGNEISVCGSRIIDESRGYLQYRFGKQNAVKLVLPKSLEHPSKSFTQTQPDWMRQATLTIRNGKFSYTVYYAEGDGDLKNGVLITKSGKKVADIPCISGVYGRGLFFDDDVIARGVEK